MKKAIKKILFSLIPTRNVIIFESSPDFTDNTYWLFKYIVGNNLFENYKFVWFVWDKNKLKNSLCGVPIKSIFSGPTTSLFKRLERSFYMHSAKIIIDSNRMVYKVSENQLRVYLGHGMPIKLAKEYCRYINKCDLLTTLGNGFKDFFAEFVDEDAIRPVGYPRNEILIDSTPDTDKFIFWMPTYRQHRGAETMRIENMFPLGIPAIKTEAELLQLEKVLENNNIKLLLRPHPAQDLSFFNISQMKNIIIANDEYLSSINCALYELISKSSALITDYSSVYYDYLLTKRPIGLTLEDHITFSKQFGLFFDNLRDELPGYLIDTAEELFDFVKSIAEEQDEYLEKREAFREKMGIEPLPSCKLITDFIKEKF
ncbi:MAG: CDP-glycerol glycerophosphotransferase family protein [Clostridia bacterium]|nr:CDP-glycerol glycerophosphotransferase family protein [Clostridia bacterium]